MNFTEMTVQERISTTFSRLPKTAGMVRARMDITNQEGEISLEDLAKTIVGWKQTQGRIERMEHTNDPLAARAREKGLDEYAVLERAAKLEFDAGHHRCIAEAIALGECICEGDKCVSQITPQTTDPFGGVEGIEEEAVRGTDDRGFDPFG